MTILKRTLAMKSCIGFGPYKDVTVYQMISTRKEGFLIKIYYTCSNIDFNQEIKDELCITKDREIEKPSKSWEKFKEHRKSIFADINSKNKTEHFLGAKARSSKDIKDKKRIETAKITSKGGNKLMQHKKVWTR